MRCSICDTLTTGGPLVGTCKTCRDIIDENFKGTDEEVEDRVAYSVIPSITDGCGRVIGGKYYE